MRLKSTLWTAAAALVFGLVSVRSETVVISEIMYHAPGNKPEYIEIYNNTLTPFDIADWRLRGGVEYDFPSFTASNPALTFLKPFERIVLTSADSATLRAVYNIPSTVRVYGPWQGHLSDGGERITLKDKNGVIVCTVEYNDRRHWSPAADGAGHSLVLKDPNRLVDDWRNWTVSQRPDGTPGTEPVAGAETAVASPEINLSQGIILVDYGQTWSYEDKNNDLGAAWREPAFDDSSWLKGPGLLGFETAALPAPGLQTPLNDVDQLTFYLRTKFVYQGETQGATLTLDQILDDGAVYYLNGNEIGRSRMPVEPPTFTTPASAVVSDATEETNIFSINNSFLIKGTNVLAVEVHQVNNTSSDVVFGARLRLSVLAQGGVVINEVLPSRAGSGFIEFYNPNSEAVNLKGFYLSDNAGNLKKFPMASDLIIPPRGFGSVGFVESGFLQVSPVVVYLTAPDGATVVNAISAGIALDGRALGRKPAGSNNWFLFTEATRNQANSSLDTLANTLRLNEIHFTSSNTVDWVELQNLSENALAADGFFLAARRDFSDQVPLRGLVPGQGVVSFDVDFPVQDGELTLHLITGNRRVLDSRVFQVPLRGGALQAFPPGRSEWYATTNDTRNAFNNPERNTDIVINEIMYNPPADHLEGEYVELFNRGATAVDVSGWKFEEGIDFEIPPGTSMLPGGYLSVAANVARMRSAYGTIVVLGNFQGRLSNRGELIRLVDQWGNLADEVDYKVGGDWPDLAKSGGSSMELLNAWMDNNLASAWKDSDESAKAPMRPYAYTATYRQLRTLGSASDYKELFFHLVGDSHVVLENIELVKLSAGTNLILNGAKLSTNGVSAGGWLCQGIHWASYMNGSQFHLIADGRGDNRPNRVEIDLPGLNPGDNCELRFRARWVSGNPRLITQTWDHSIANSFRLEIPENLGTPGARNSRARASPAPQIDALLHSPAVPRSTQNVKVTARVSSVEPLSSVRLFHRLDNVNGNAAWTNKVMFDNGINGGDEVAGDGLYTAELTEYKANSRVVQFYVRAEAQNQLTAFLPKQGASKPALCVVDDRTVQRDLRTVRFVVSAFDIDAIANGGGAKFNYKFPRLQNHYFNMTFISNEKDIYYGGEVRNSGSPWTRGTDLSRGKWKLPDDRLFRGHYKFTFDNDADGQLSNNRVTRYLLYLMGHPVNENEFIRLIVNTGGINMREDTEAVDNDLLDRNFENGSAGDLYRIDDEWWFTDSWSREYRNADWKHKGSDNPGRYRTEWMKRTNEEQDDFSALINFFKVVSTNYTQNQIERLIDPHATLKMAVVRGYISDWDSFSLSRGKNGFFYRRSTDGLFQFLHWDSDLAFGNVGDPLFSGVPGFGPWLSKPYNKRMFYSYLVELIEKYTKGSARMNAWLKAEEEASNSYSARTSFFQSWFTNRLRTCTNAMGANYTRPFEITTNAGNPLTTAADTISLNGSSPYGILHAEVEGHPEALFAWTGETTWTVTGIRLQNAENVLRLKGLDQRGNLLREDSISVVKTGNAPPFLLLKASSDSWQVQVDQAFEIDARDSYDPEGTPLTYSWTVAPSERVTLATNQFAAATALFARPGLYNITVQAADQNGQSSLLTREAAVYGPSGFSPFNAVQLESHWILDRVAPRDNYSPGAWFSLTDVPGQLMLQVLDDSAKPLAAAGALYPFIWRALPGSAAWSFHTKVRLDSRQFGDFLAGLLVEIVESGSTNRYAFGLDGGNLLSVQKLPGTGTATTLKSIANPASEAILRVRRAANSLLFEQRMDGVWTEVHAVALAAPAQAASAGLFLATSQPQAVKVGFDYATLVDPSNMSELRESLRISELMYNPVDGDDFEFIELINVGSTALDLTGARFTNGITYAFGPILLQGGRRIVLVKDLASFATIYNTNGMNIAAGSFAGKLDNGGETLTLVDAQDELIFSFTYDDEGDWPERADGFGSSLEIIDPQGDLEDPDNWRSSAEYNGSPSTMGLGPARSVVINDVLAHSDPPLEDAIELCNLTPNPIDIGGWYLSDSGSNLKKFRIPNGTVIPAKGYTVFFEEQFNINNTLVPFALSSAQGDEVYLVTADAAGKLLQFADHVEFGASENGISLGRYPDGTGPLTAMSQLTFGTAITAASPPDQIALFRTGRGAPNAYPKVGPVVISQIMYHAADDGDEFIELRNISGSAVPLFDPLHPTNTWKLGQAADYSFPPNILLQSNQTLLIVGIDPSVFRARNNITNTVPIVGPYNGTLDNAGESIELLKPDAPQTIPPNVGLVPYLLVDKVRYDNDPPWPPLADGHGPSLKRIYLAGFGNDPFNWSTENPQLQRDTDGDGMPDSWELDHGLNQNSNADAAFDSDGDGLSNLQEFRSGTAPQDPLSYLKIDTGTKAGDSFTIRFLAVAGKSYTILFRDSLDAGPWTRLADVSPQPGSQIVALPDPGANTSNLRFYRLVTPQLP